MKYRVDRCVRGASGYQTFEVDAETLEEAKLKFKSGQSEIVDHEVEVTDLDEFDVNEIYEYGQANHEH